MKPTLFLRIASILTFVHCVLHTFGGVLSSPRHGAEEVAVIEAMKSHSFDVMGSMRSYWDFFFGYGSSSRSFYSRSQCCFGSWRHSQNRIPSG